MGCYLLTSLSCCIQSKHHHAHIFQVEIESRWFGALIANNISSSVLASTFQQLRIDDKIEVATKVYMYPKGPPIKTNIIDPTFLASKSSLQQRGTERLSHLSRFCTDRSSGSRASSSSSQKLIHSLLDIWELNKAGMDRSSASWYGVRSILHNVSSSSDVAFIMADWWRAGIPSSSCLQCVS